VAEESKVLRGQCDTPGSGKRSRHMLKALHEPSVNVEYVDEAALLAAIVIIGTSLLRVLLGIGHYYVVSNRLNIVRRKAGRESIVKKFFRGMNSLKVCVEFFHSVLRKIGCQQEIVAVFLYQRESGEDRSLFNDLVHCEFEGSHRGVPSRNRAVLRGKNEGRRRGRFPGHIGDHEIIGAIEDDPGWR